MRWYLDLVAKGLILVGAWSELGGELCDLVMHCCSLGKAPFVVLWVMILIYDGVDMCFCKIWQGY